MNTKILIVAGAAVVLLGGGAGAYFYFGQEKHAEAKAEPAPQAPAPVFIALDQISVPVLQDDRVTAYYFVAVSLQVADEAKRAKVMERLPLIRDAFLRDVYMRSAMRKDAPDGLDFDGLKSRFLNLTQRVLGPGIVDDVLVTRAIRAVG
ncbi:MAG TPA: flagellar basal body-associated FliL family protein [Candidatus Cybelea sp.]|nr:flagellar basal body-associated FliL family protein [Candidatus Cybelea sp.]